MNLSPYFNTYLVCIADLDLATDAVLQMDKISNKYPILIAKILMKNNFFFKKTNSFLNKIKYLIGIILIFIISLHTYNVNKF